MLTALALNSASIWNNIPSRGNDDCRAAQMSNFPYGQSRSEREDVKPSLTAPPVSLTEATPRLTIRRRLAKAQVLGAVAGLVGGISSALFGAGFTAASWLAANQGARQWLSTVGTTLFFLTIPLLIFGGYCMDWMEKGKPQHHSKVVRYEDEDDDQ